MFGSLGGAELLLILVLALLLFGPRRLPQIGRTIGQAMSEFRRATQDLKTSLEREVHSEELRETRAGLQELGREIGDAVDEVNPKRMLDESLRAGGRGSTLPRSRGAVTPAPEPDPAADEDSPEPGRYETRPEES